MKSIVVYGSTTGNTQAAAEKIAKKLGAENIPVGDCKPENLADCDLLVFGASAWGTGDLQDDWDSALSVLTGVELSGKRAALFGLGDQDRYPDTFVDGMGTLYDAVVKSGAEVVGMTDTEEYDYSDTAAIRDGKFVGLVLDEDNQADMSDSRIDAWVKDILG